MDKTEKPSRKRVYLGLIVVAILAGMIALVWSRGKAAFIVLGLIFALFALLLHGCGNYGDGAGRSKSATLPVVEISNSR
jgi:hypothetical protein